METEQLRLKQPNGQRQPASRAANGKKFSVTVSVPEEVASRWPEWFATDKLLGEAYKAAAVAAAPSRARTLSRLGMVVVGMLIFELFVAGVILGYLAAGRYQLVSVIERRQAAPDASGQEAAVSEPPVAATDAPEPTDSAGSSSAGSSMASSSSGAMSAAAGATASSRVNASRKSASAKTGTLRALAANPARTYRVQLGVYRQRANADELVGRLRGDGFQPTVRTSRGRLFVEIRSLKTRAAAEQLAAQLRAKRYNVVVVP